MDAGKKKRIIIMVASWLVIIGVIGLVYKFVVEPWIRGRSCQRDEHTTLRP